MNECEKTKSNDEVDKYVLIIHTRFYVKHMGTFKTIWVFFIHIYMTYYYR